MRKKIILENIMPIYRYGIKECLIKLCKSSRRQHIEINLLINSVKEIFFSKTNANLVRFDCMFLSCPYAFHGESTL